MISRGRNSRVHLPRRNPAMTPARCSGHVGPNPGLVEALADRIGSLPGVECRFATIGRTAGPRQYYLDNAFTVDPTGEDSVPFATLDTSGRVSMTMPMASVEEVTRSGWGELRSGRIRTFPPRDPGDLTVLWRIVLMAYFDIAERRDFSAWRDTRHPSRHPGPGQTGYRVVAPGAFF